MHRSIVICTLILLAGIRPSAVALSDPSDRVLPELTQRLDAIDTELARTARYTLCNGVGRIGWFSAESESPDQPEWAKVELYKNTQIDRIVLVPALWDHVQRGPQADGFPAAFVVIAGRKGDAKGQVVARFGPEDQILPRIAPLVIPIQPTTAAWVRIRTTQLSKSAKGGKYVCGFSEIMVFNGERNVALNRPVRVSSTIDWGGAAITRQSLTDGFTPFLMDAGSGKRSPRYLAQLPSKMRFWFSIDLGETCPVDEIRFHSASDIKKYIPLRQQVEEGIPRQLTVEGANLPDFSDAVRLLEYQRNSVFDAGPILMRNLPETPCRYIRFSTLEPNKVDGASGKHYFNLSELEILSDGQNVAKGKPVRVSSQPGVKHQFTESITDGRNSFGPILTIRNWMEQLARRHDLERERPQVEAALARRYVLQKINLNRMYWVATLLVVAIGLSILIERTLRRRQLGKMRTRFAADLHDELGANLHAIGLLGDLAKEAVHSPEELIETVDQIRALTERTSKAARFVADIYEARLCDDLKADMKQTARRILADIEYDLSVEGEEILRKLKPRIRADLFLFYKESLVNVSRHSGASQCRIRCIAGKKEILLTTYDNGKGLSGPVKNQIPASLQRRARFLKAKLTIETPPDGGTQITLRLRRCAWRVAREKFGTKSGKS
jgi:signal transduction histidine kinase